MSESLLNSDSPYPPTEDLVLWENELPANVRLGLLGRETVFSDLLRVENQDAQAAAQALQTQFNRLRISPDGHQYHRVPLRDGYLCVAVVPPAHFTGPTPTDLCRVIINRSSRYGATETLQLTEYVMSLSQRIMTKQSAEVQFSPTNRTAPACTPPIIRINTSGCSLHESPGYTQFLPPSINKATPSAQPRYFHEEVQYLLGIFSGLSRQVTEEPLVR